MNFRAAQGSRIDWRDTRIEAGFSNFLFIDRQYRSHSVLRRIFSLARKLDCRSLLIEEISEANCRLSWSAGLPTFFVYRSAFRISSQNSIFACSIASS